MATDTALDAVQKAIFGVLNADTALQAKAKVYDFVPEPSSFPYVSVGDDDETTWNTFGRVGRDVSVTLHVWSQYSGWKEADSILSDLIRLLDFPSTPLTITGWTITAISVYEGATKMRDPDGLTRHIVARFRVYAEQ